MREARAAGSGFPQGFAEDVFIAQLYNRSVLLNSGFQVMSGHSTGQQVQNVLAKNVIICIQ